MIIYIFYYLLFFKLVFNLFFNIKKVRKINIMNTLTEHVDLIECCQEETINEILERYKKYNDHAESYTWKRLKKKLDMDLTLIIINKLIN